MDPVLPRPGAIFTHHLAKMIMLSLVPATPIVDYDMPCDKLIEQAVWFSLRGMGVKDEAILRYYNPGSPGDPDRLTEFFSEYLVSKCELTRDESRPTTRKQR